MDETTVSLHPAPGRPLSLHVFGGYHWPSGQVSYTTAAHKNSDSFIAVVEHLPAESPQQALLLVMNNPPTTTAMPFKLP